MDIYLTTSWPYFTCIFILILPGLSTELESGSIQAKLHGDPWLCGYRAVWMCWGGAVCCIVGKLCTGLEWIYGAAIAVVVVLNCLAGRCCCWDQWSCYKKLVCVVDAIVRLLCWRRYTLWQTYSTIYSTHADDCAMLYGYVEFFLCQGMGRLMLCCCCCGVLVLLQIKKGDVCNLLCSVCVP